MLVSQFLGLVLPAAVSALPDHPNRQNGIQPSKALFDENIYARTWRAALSGSNNTYPEFTKSSCVPSPGSGTPGTWEVFDPTEWTAGFFPDLLWQAYYRWTVLQPGAKFENAPKLDAWLAYAQATTDPLIVNENRTDTHDLGFLAYPFESALRIRNERSWLPVLRQMADGVASRFVPTPGVIRSWDTNNASWGQRGSHEDSVLVIIDNMMNLGLLARSAKEYSHNTTLLDLAISHANKTRDHHVRPDGSTFHVCDYSANTGALYLCRTAQGLADNSTWARGQAWAIYGFAQMYQYTNDPSYLETSIRTADYFLDHLPTDGLPYWDFDAPYDPDSTPRDTSAATAAASGLLLLHEQLERSSHAHQYQQDRYATAAVQLLNACVDLALAYEITFSEIGSDPAADLGATTGITTPANTTVTKGFEAILMHGTVNNNPHTGIDANYDTGIVYADFYFLEAGNRLLERRLRQEK